MRKLAILSPAQAAALVNDEDTIVICGCENVLAPNTLLKALGDRFRATQHPRDLTEVHPIIVGMGPDLGLENLAHRGMIKRAIGSGYSFLKTSRYTELLKQDAFEAHVAPMGTLYQIICDTASGKPFTLTRVGLETFVDPASEGGMINKASERSLASRIEIDGVVYLKYERMPIQIAFLRGTTADESGNISLEQEPVSLGVKSLAMAVKNSGGKVIVQVSRMTQSGSIHPRMVEIPGIFVDAVVVDPQQPMSGGALLNSALTGETRLPIHGIAPVPRGLERIVVSRAADEVEQGQIVNLGVGMPIGIPKILVERGEIGKATFFPEHGSVGGVPGERAIFGTNINPEAIIDSTQVFEFFRGGGLDISFLGFGQIDAEGNVNVSKFNGIVPGCGGFIDIAHGTKKIVFCGSFNAGGLEMDIGEGRLNIRSEGRFPKFVQKVEQVTFNGREARRRGQTVRYVTERAVFALVEQGLVVIEVAPGIDLRTQVLNLLPFAVAVAPDVKTMNSAFFS